MGHTIHADDETRLPSRPFHRRDGKVHLKVWLRFRQALGQECVPSASYAGGCMTRLCTSHPQTPCRSCARGEDGFRIGITFLVVMFSRA
jgi:hypothetical protein